MNELDRLSTADLLHEARRHMDAWSDLNNILNEWELPSDRRLAIWHTAEDHAETAAAMIGEARLRMAEEAISHA